MRLSTLDRARAYVAQVSGAIEGKHGDSQTLAVANVLVWDFALSPSEALPIFWEYNNRCSPRWTEAQLSASSNPQSASHTASRAATSWTSERAPTGERPD